MKKIMISSLLAITTCLTMASQANAAPHFTDHHTAQVKHQKAGAGVNNKYKHVKHVKHKPAVSHHNPKKIKTAHSVKSKYQGKHIEGHRT